MEINYKLDVFFCINRRKSNKSFTYDYCFDSSSADKPNYASKYLIKKISVALKKIIKNYFSIAQQAVYDGLGVDILENSMAGYNACIFAYGQTGKCLKNYS